MLIPKNQSWQHCTEKLSVVCQKPLIGLWGAWSQWSNCPCYSELGSRVWKYRTRYCNDPKPHKFAIDEKRICGKYNNSIGYQNAKINCPPLRYASREMFEIENVFDIKEDICRSLYNPYKNIRDDAKLIERNYKGSNVKDCLTWCIKRADCQELNILIDSKKMKTLNDNLNHFKCISSNKFCTFIKRDLAASFLFRRSTLTCQSKFARTCRTAMYHHELETGLCILYESNPKTYKNALKHCSLFGMHLMKYEHFYGQTGLVNFHYYIALSLFSPKLLFIYFFYTFRHDILRQSIKKLKVG